MRSFTQMLNEYQAYAIAGDTIEKAATRLIAEQVHFIAATRILIRVYAVNFEEAKQCVRVLANKEHYDSPDAVARFIDDYQTLSERDKGIEPTVVRLHAQGLSVGDALRILRRLYNIHLGEAKRFLFGHPVWHKEHEFSEKMLELFFSQDDGNNASLSEPI